MPNIFDAINGFADRTIPKIEGLLGDPTFNLGVGLLAESGPSPYKKSFGQVLAGAQDYASNRQMQTMRLQQAREQIEQKKRRSEAQAQIPGLLDPSNVPAGIRAPQELLNQRMTGLLAEAYPEQIGAQLAQGLFVQPEQPRLSTGLNDFQAITGRLPNSAEEFAEFQAGQDPAAAVQAQLAQAQLQAAQNSLAHREEEQRVETVTTRLETNQDLASLEELYHANEVLEDSFLATGRTIPSTRRALTSVLSEIKAATGMNNAKEEEILEAFDTFKKQSERLTNNVAARYGASTNIRYQGVANSIPNIGLNPSANKAVISTMINDLLLGSEELGIEINNPDRFRSLTQPAPAPAPAPASDGDEILDFTELP